MGERRRRRTRRGLGAAAALAAAVVAVVIAIDATTEPPTCTPLGDRDPERKTYDRPPCEVIDRSERYIATLETTLGPIRIYLNPPLAPAIINNFVFLAKMGFYDGTILHRVENEPDHALVQGGDPTGTGRGGPGYTFAGEEPSPITRYVRGAVASLNPGDPTKAGSQFFIVIRDYERLALPETFPKYPLFGFVSDPESLETLDAIATAPREGIRPRPPIRIERVTVEEVETE